MAEVGSGPSIATAGWIVASSSDDRTAPDQGTFALASVTDTTATYNVTAPDVADYDHMEAWYMAEGDTTPTEDLTFDGTITGLTAHTKYIGGLAAVDAAGNRSTVMPFSFKTLQGVGGTYNYRVSLTFDQESDARVTQDCDITVDRTRVPARERGEFLEIDVTMTEEGQSLEFIGYTVERSVLDRRAE